MASNKKRFPSDANKAKPGMADPAPKAVKAAPVKAVAKSQDLVKVTYHVDNHHHLHGVHALRKGVNSLPRAVWEEAKKHPSVKKLIADGKAVEASSGVKVEEIKKAPEAQAEQTPEGQAALEGKEQETDAE